MNPNNRSILVVRTDLHAGVDHTALRDYILECVQLGVLLLGMDDTLEILELPPLGGVTVTSKEKPELPPKESRERSIGALGRNSGEKRDIMERLKKYREKNGLGCWAAVAQASGWKLDEDKLRGMCSGTVLLPISEWRCAANTLAKLEAEDG